MNRRLFLTAAITVLAMLWCSCGKGELDITLRTPEGPDEPTQPSDLRIGNMTEPIALEARPTLTWKPAQDRSATGIKGYWVSIDSAEDWTWVEGITTWTSPTDLSDGPHMFRVKAEDHAGHVGSYTSLSFEVELGRPDFTVSGLSYTPVNPKAGDDLTISITVKNQGDASGRGRLEVSVNSPMKEGQKTLRFEILRLDLAPGTEKTFTTPWSAEEMWDKFTWRLDPGEHSLMVAVIAEGLLADEDELNNEKSIPVVILAQ